MKQTHEHQPFTKQRTVRNTREDEQSLERQRKGDITTAVNNEANRI